MNSNSHLDAELLALGHEFDRLGAEADRLAAAVDALDERAWQMIGIPDVLRPRDDDAALLAPYDCPNVVEHYFVAHRDKLRMRREDVSAATLRRRNEIIKAVNRLEEDHAAASAQLGEAAAEARYQDARDRVHVVGLRILALRAQTIDGLAVKARCARWCAGDIGDHVIDRFDDVQALYSLARDVLVITGQPMGPTAAVSDDRETATAMACKAEAA